MASTRLSLPFMPGFINRVSTLPKKFTELEVVNFPKAFNNGIETVGNVVFWIVVGFFGFWIISKFVANIKTLREEG